jgi:heme/copper-type cytochrome/quinol oxidase subunit 2
MLTAKDVLHSWAVPNLGVKVDATTGRSNKATIVSLLAGEILGQCSELCGLGHGTMPIVVKLI